MGHSYVGMKIACRPLRGVRPLAAGVLVLLGALALPGCGPGLEEFVEGSGSQRLPPIQLVGITSRGYRDGSEEYVLSARRATVQAAGDRTVLLESVEIRFEDPLRGDLAVRSDLGELDLSTEDFVLRGDVNGLLDGQTFETDVLRFDQSTRRLLTDQPVLVQRGSLRLRGKGMEYDVTTRKLSFVDVETTADR